MEINAISSFNNLLNINFSTFSVIYMQTNVNFCDVTKVISMAFVFL